MCGVCALFLCRGDGLAALAVGCSVDGCHFWISFPDASVDGSEVRAIFSEVVGGWVIASSLTPLIPFHRDL